MDKYAQKNLHTCSEALPTKFIPLQTQIFHWGDVPINRIQGDVDNAELSKYVRIMLVMILIDFS